MVSIKPVSESFICLALAATGHRRQPHIYYLIGKGAEIEKRGKRRKKRKTSSPYNLSESSTPSPPVVTPIEEEPNLALVDIKPMIILVNDDSPAAVSTQLFSNVQLSPHPASPTDTAALPNIADIDLSLSQLVADLTIPPAEPVVAPRRYAFLDANNASGQIINFSDGPLCNRDSVVIDGFNHADDNPVSYSPAPTQIILQNETVFNGATYPTLFD